MKHPIYTEKSNISFEKYEPNNDSDCSINCCSKSINDCNWTTTTGISMASSGAAAAVPKGSWLTAPYGDSPDAQFFCGAGLRQFTGIGAYGWETALKEDKFIRLALPTAGNSRLESLPIGPSADGAAAASAAVAASVDSAKKLSSDSVQSLQLSFFF